MRRSFAAQAFITCSRKGDWREANKADLNGLVQGHAYTITGNFYNQLILKLLIRSTSVYLFIRLSEIRDIHLFLLGLYRIKADSISSKELSNSNKNSPGVDDPRIHLIRVRNPWGDKNEWRGKDRYNETIVSILKFWCDF